MSPATASTASFIKYPLLPVETGSRLAFLKATAWCLTAVLLHSGLYVVAVTAADSHRPSPKPRREKPSDHIMIVNDLDIDEIINEEPPPPPEPAEQVATESAPAIADTPKPSTKPRPTRKRQQPAPTQQPLKTAQETPPQASEQFRDIGVMGSVDIGATGPGGSSFSVAVGNSGVGGPIGRSGRIEGIAAPHATATKMPAPPPPPPKAVSIRNLSRKARPNAGHNRRIKAPYPKHLREEDVSGEVQAVLIVLPDGTVGNVKILKSAHEAFAKSAMKVLRQFLFEPALDKHGEAVTSKVKLTYRFTLE